MTTRITFDPTTEQFEAKDMNNPASPTVPTTASAETTTVSINKNAAATGRLTVNNGKATYEEVGPQRVTTTQVDPNMVLVGGMSTPRVVAEQLLAAGDISAQQIQDPMGQLGSRVAQPTSAPTSKQAHQTLKTEKLVLDWRNKTQAKSAVQQAIKLTLDRGLPDAYDEAIFTRKCDSLYRHIYDAYQGGGESIYAAA